MTDDKSAAVVRDRNRRLFASPFAALYDFYIQREWVSLPVARLIWGSDIRPYYASMTRIGAVPDGGVIIDAPCGSGAALRGLHREQRVRYLAYDLSPGMLARARRRSSELGLRQVELAEADAQSLPAADGAADLFVSYFGLHCLPDPAAALQEAARCLRPGGELAGATITLGTRPLDRLRVRPGFGLFGPVGTPADLRRWLAEAGMAKIELDLRGVFAYFEARKPA